MATSPALSVYVLHASTLTAVSFAAHYAWESIQCPLFFVHGTVPGTRHAMVVATLGDVAMTWMAQVAVAIVTYRWLWTLDRWNLRVFVVLGLLAVVLSVAIELRALATGRWSYSAINPTLPGTPVSIVPVLQLLVLFPATFGICRALLRSKNA